MISSHPMYTILIVDDNPKNLFTLKTLLSEMLDAEIIEASSGAEALDQIAHHKTDLILLDIKMPDMDGFEVARLIRNRKKYQDVPIIFLTAFYKSDEFKHRGLEGGAIDYLTKPIDDNILINRVKAYLRVIEGERAINLQLEQMNAQLQQEIEQRKQAEQALQKLNEELERRVSERTQELQETNAALETSLDTLRLAQEQLIQSETLAALGGLVAGLSHEISTPIGVSVTAASYLEEQARCLKGAFEEGRLTKSEFLQFLDLTLESSPIILRNLQQASGLIHGFKHIAVDQSSGEKRRFFLKSYLDEILLSLHPKLKKTRHTVTVHCPESLELESYPGAFSQIFTNLIMNTLMHGFDGVEQGEIVCDITAQDGQVLVEFRDNGIGISPEHLGKIFDPFFTTKREQGGSGLGLNIIRNLVEHQLGGTIRCESRSGEGTSFFIAFPQQTSMPINLKSGA
ncbi:signal transduction histidine kinase [Candidatus Moduliflexus flocculans]|uniref:histidine kinase n=1 Tax=Candidatus Moduliflexus flocculans TaxID=1499966 RepID=A0A081BQE7_9BACT|nr:signal transduction histidine kinase [Candidatus Moduliflexus flocculans]